MDNEKFNIFIKKHYAVCIICLLLLLLVVIPLVCVQTFKGHDVYFHMTRMEALAQELEAGNIPSRLYYFVYEGYGYASPMFYGDVFLTIPALLIMMGMSMPLAYKAFMIICLCACVLVAYYCGKKMFESKVSGLVFAFAYGVSSYFAVDVFTRAAVGEMQAFVFIPFCFLGLYSILKSDGKYWYWLPAGLACVLVCHLITAVMTVVFLAVFALVHLGKLIKNPRKIGSICICVLVFVLVAANFLLPLLEQLSDTAFKATDGSSATVFGTMAERAMSVLELFSLTNLSHSNDPWIPNGIGFLPIVLLVLRLIVLNKEKSVDGDMYLWVCGLGLFLMSNLFPWKLDIFQNLFGTIQFPWRIMLFATLFLALAAADYVKYFNKEALTAYTVTVCALSLVAFCSVYFPRYSLYASYETGNVTVNYYEGRNIGYNIGTGEFLPTGTDRGKLSNRGQIITSDGKYNRYEDFKRSENGDIIMDISVSSDMGTYLDLPVIRYNGYTAVFTDKDGNQTELPTYYGENNVLRVMINNVTADGVLTVSYEGTAIQHVSVWISGISIVSLGGFVVYQRHKKKGQAPYCEVTSSSSEPKE